MEKYKLYMICSHFNKEDIAQKLKGNIVIDEGQKQRK